MTDPQNTAAAIEILDRVRDGGTLDVPGFLAVIDGDGLTGAALHDAYLVARRLRAAATDAGSADRLDEVLVGLRTRMAKLRVAAQLDAVQQDEARQPVRRQVLEHLTRGPAIPSAVASARNVTLAQVSRMLNSLASDGLVAAEVDPDDRRRRVYALTAAGEVEAGIHLTYGQRVEAPEPLPDTALQEFLAGALISAVELRRREAAHDEVLGRLAIIEEQATGDLALLAKAEIAATYRQARKQQDADTAVAGIESEFAHGSNGARDLVLPALAVAEYEHGRQAGSSLRDGAMALEHARVAFVLCARRGSSQVWQQRAAWALIALADNFRRQGAVTAALETATPARQHFLDVGDEYGAIRATFMQGFCRRLRGEYAQALELLQEAHTAALGGGYRPFAADALMQIGETQRCLGQVSEATDALGHAREEATHLGLPITHAFAESSLGAIEFTEGRDAAGSLAAAKVVFATHHHSAGLALSHRRLGMLGGPDAALHLKCARELYQGLNVPAGNLTCLVAEAKNGSRGTVEVADELFAEIRGLQERDVLQHVQRDPWAPHILMAFAQEVDHVPLRELTHSLASLAAPSAVEPSGVESRSIAVLQMAGEHQPAHPELEIPLGIA